MQNTQFLSISLNNGVSRKLQKSSRERDLEYFSRQTKPEVATPLTAPSYLSPVCRVVR